MLIAIEIKTPLPVQADAGATSATDPLARIMELSDEERIALFS